MAEFRDLPLGPNEETDRLFQNAQRLLALQRQAHETKPATLHTSSEGIIPVEDALDILSRLDQLPLSTAEVGDVVWWQTNSGSQGYFAIKEPYANLDTGIGGMRSGKGEILISRQKGHPAGDQRGDGVINGATLGGGLRKDVIVRGMPLEYVLIDGKQNGPYTTSPVMEMGVIKASQLIPAK
jgi:hypothetical protein